MLKKFVLFAITFVLFLNCENLLSLLEPSPDGSIQVELITNKKYYSPKDTLVITIFNRSTKPFFLEGCSAFAMANLSDSGWVASPLHICVWEGFAKKIPAGESYQESYPAEAFLGVHKIYSSVFWECQEGYPISQAQCHRMEKVFSPEFSVQKKN